MTEPVRVEGLVTVSVVSHGQMSLVVELLEDLSEQCSTPLEIIVTINVDEPVRSALDEYPFPVVSIRNDTPKGFGANHDSAFERARGEYFCVINPDIRLTHDPFPSLIDALDLDAVGVAAPRVVSPDGNTEDSARAFPTPSSLMRKLWRRVIRREEPEPEYLIGDEPIFPDWIGGMCMLFRSATFREIGGFDERYFLYYEDVDLCWRLRRSGRQVVLDPRAVVVHGARRSSWRKFRYMRWHLTSMLRFLMTRARG
jgi:N-acetylglucosaminyl-diphospho-decaprenol L-rhamnosyltransferase